MGACVSSKSSCRKSPQFDKQPPGTSQLKHSNLSRLQFNLTLANIKLKKCTYSKVLIKFNVPEIFEYEVQPQNIAQNSQVKWKSQKKTRFQMNQLQLRKRFLHITVHDCVQKKQIGKIKINLYLITIGPYHQDFLIELKNHTNVRLSFDFKISQIVDIKIDSEYAEVDLIKKHPGEKFSFSIKPIMEEAQNEQNISAPSYTVMEVLDENQEEIEIESSMRPSPTRKTQSPTISPQLPERIKLSKRTLSVKIKQPQKKIKLGSNLTWNKDKSLQLPSMKLKILSSDLHHSYFQILIWKVYDHPNFLQSSQQQQILQETLQYHAQCFISFHKLLSHQPFLNIVDGKRVQEREINIESKLWMYGRECGVGKFHFKINNEMYMKQMPVCVRTQKGIEKLQPIFISTETNEPSEHKQIQKLTQINLQISNKMIESEKLISEFNMYREARKLQIQIQDGLMEMRELLEKSMVKTIRIYQYSTPKQLIFAQETFLEIGNQIKDYLQNEDHSINQMCWLILTALLKRGEFTLAYIGFDEKQRKEIESNNKNKLLERKIRVAEKYQQFICEILKLAINALNTEGMDCEKQFAQISCAYAYFRITQFRNQVLESITRQSDPQINQWRGIEFMLDQDQDFTFIREEMNALSLLFDWQHCFHKCLKKETKIQEILSDEESQQWKQRFAKRSIAFFQFIKRWIQYIESIIPSGKGIQWRYCPGYNRILKAFLIQLKTREIKLYPDALKQAAMKLLVHEKVISPMITILFNKVNLYDTQAVAQVLQFISQMFLSLQKRKKKIPAIFNFPTFLKGIKLILQSQASYSVSAALILFYNHLQIFPLQFQRNISMFLLSRVFFRLFLHWQQNVREIFYHLLIYRVLHQYKVYSNNNDQKVEEKQERVLKKKYNFEIHGRYEKLMMILKNAEITIDNQDKKLSKILLDKQLYLRMKKKFEKKRKKKFTNKINQNYQNICDNQNDANNIEENFKSNQMNQFEDDERQTEFYDPTSTGMGKYHRSSIYQPPLIIDKIHSERFNIGSEKMNKFDKLDKSEKDKQNHTASILQNFKSFKTQVFNGQNHHPNRINHFPNQVKDMTQLDNDSKQHRKRMKNSIQQTYHHLKLFGKQQQFDINQLKPKQLHYLKIALRRFNQILEDYKKNYKDERFEIPLIKMQKAMIDRKELQPDKVEDW